MIPEDIQIWIAQNPELAFASVVLLSLIVYIIARTFIARGLMSLALKTESKYDDIIVESLRPFRFAYIAPLFLLYYFTYLLPDIQELLQDIILFLVLWVVILTSISLLNAVNNIYESREQFTGVSIQSYMDIIKLLILAVGLILSTSLITGVSPIGLLTGLGALTAVLLLIFKDTLLSLVASVQIQVNDLVREGDWIEVSSFGADGDVLDIALHTIRIQNWDKTITVIPTYKLMEVSFKNWRGMQESGGRRIKRSIYLDQSSIHFCDDAEIKQYKKNNLVRDYVTAKQEESDAYNKTRDIDPKQTINGRQITNVGIFRAYIAAYLKDRDDIHQEGLTFLIRQLPPSATGLPIEIYVFTKTTEWTEYEMIQADIFEHFLSVVPEFGLRVFQEPTGLDFAALAER